MINSNDLNEVVIELTNKCNFRCLHCYLSKCNNRGLTLSEYIKLFSDLRDMGTFDLVFTGGEVLLRSDFIDIVRAARYKGFSVNILSNGYLLTEKIATELSNLYINSFGVTLFSMDSSVNDYITKSNNSVENIIKNIFILHKNDVKVEVKCPVLIYNFDTYMTVKKFCDEYDIPFISTAQITDRNDGETKEHLRINRKDGYNVMKKELPNIYGVKNKFNPNAIPCEVLHKSLFIDSIGKVYPCSTFYYEVGDLRKSSIKDIWNSELVFNIQKIRNKDLICIDCEYKDYCDRCIGLAHADGNMLGCSKYDFEFAIEKFSKFRR